MHAFALPNDRDAGAAWAGCRRRKSARPSPKAPSPPRCRKSRRVRPSHSVRGVPQSRIMSPSPIQDVRADDVLAPFQHGRAFVHKAMIEDQGHARPGDHVYWVAEQLERGGPALETLVEVHHEGQVAALAVVALEVTVRVWGEILSGLV